MTVSPNIAYLKTVFFFTFRAFSEENNVESNFTIIQSLEID